MTVKVEGLEPVLRMLANVEDVADVDVLGTVYSAGADQGHGRYEHYVQDADWQADVHVGRWQTVQSVAESQEQQAAREYEDAIQAILNGTGVNMRQTAEQILRRLYELMVKYPAPPAGSRYVRTGTLGRSWAIENTTR